MITSMRTPRGGRIDRGKPIRFSFDGMPYEGCAGDTLASALLANGVHLVARSFKYHRPRGIISAGSEEPNALVTIDRGRGRTTPNLRATQVEIYDGLIAESQNRWPALNFDIGAINNLVSPLLSTGFYYKTFMGPRQFGIWPWRKIFEPAIRRAAGLGDAPLYSDRDRYAQFYEHCDVLIIGAGPAGLAAAVSAGETGARVILCDEQAEMGGSLLAEKRARIDGAAAMVWRDAVLLQLESMPNVRLMPRTQAFGYYAQNFIGLCENATDHLANPEKDMPRERLWQVRAKQVLLATGAIERPLVFPDNDRPGIMLADAARTYLNRYGVKIGHQAVIVTNHDSAYQVALDLADAGVMIEAIADLRQNPQGPLINAARKARITVLDHIRVSGTAGGRHVRSVEMTRLQGNGLVHRFSLECDALLMCGGWTPSVHLFSQSRGQLQFDHERGIYIPGTNVQAVVSIGACNGTSGFSTILNESAAAGRSAAKLANAPEEWEETHYAVSHTHETHGDASIAASNDHAAHAKAFVDFQNDVCAKDIAQALREGMRSIEHVKRYTTTGMATDQGKTSNMNALGMAAQSLSKSIPEVGLTTFRPPYTPVTFGTIAGASRWQLFDPVRRTPIHAWAEKAGAQFEDVGQWKRAWYLPAAGESRHAAVMRECNTTRASAGFFDASTLGKIEVNGPDAAEFLNRIYTTDIRTLSPRRCRYGLMLNEQGFVMDDGIIARLADNRFHLTTTTGGAARVLAHMEDYLQTEWPHLQCWLTSVTEQWGVIAIQGPHARDIIAPYVIDIDISPTAMPHMSVNTGHIAGIPMRMMRVSFTGELGYELNIPASQARQVWDILWEEGKRHGATAYGTEAMHVMRAEKGYIIIGQETDGTVTPNDIGLSWAIGKTKKDFVGMRSLMRPDMIAKNRKQLVGLLTDTPEIQLEEGAQIIAEPAVTYGMHAIGHVTSSYFSPALNRTIALALIENGRQRHGEKMFATGERKTIPVTVTSPQFFDPQGSRLHG